MSVLITKQKNIREIGLIKLNRWYGTSKKFHLGKFLFWKNGISVQIISISLYRLSMFFHLNVAKKINQNLLDLDPENIFGIKEKRESIIKTINTMTVNNFTQEKITRLISLGIVISFIQSILTGFNQHLKNCNAENLSLRLRCLMVDNIILSKYHTAFNFTPGLFSAVVINETTEFSTIVIELISNIVILPITIVTAISIMIWLNQYNVQTLGKFFTYLASHSSFIEGSVIENIQFFDESVSCDRINKMSKLLGFDDFFLQLAGRI